MIGEITLAITAGVGLGQIGPRSIPTPPRPRSSEKRRTLAADKLTPTAKRAFGAFFRLIG